MSTTGGARLTTLFKITVLSLATFVISTTVSQAQSTGGLRPGDIGTLLSELTLITYVLVLSGPNILHRRTHDLRTSPGQDAVRRFAGLLSSFRPSWFGLDLLDRFSRQPTVAAPDVVFDAAAARAASADAISAAVSDQSFA